MEHVILEALAFDMGSVTAHSFHYIFTVGSTLPVRELSLYLMELTLLDGRHFLRYRPSVISAAAVCTTRQILRHPPWPAEFVTLHVGTDLTQLRACVTEIHRLLIKIATIPELIARGKYANSNLFDVNALPIPAESPMASPSGPSSFFPVASPATPEGHTRACAGPKIVISPLSSPVPTKVVAPPSPRGKGTGAKPEVAAAAADKRLAWPQAYRPTRPV